MHEVAIAPDSLKKTDPKYNILAHHTTPEQACKIFNIVKPKLAVYSHIVRLYGHTTEEIMARSKANYSNPIAMGEDLMSFLVGDIVTTKVWGENNYH